MPPVTALGLWGSRRWLSALLAAVTTLLVLGLPTDLIPNPVFGRQIDPPWWTWPVLVATSVLSGLLFATYVRNGAPGQDPDTVPLEDAAGKRGLAGGILTFFAVGCPVCNKIVLLALGYAGALKWFEPVQPFLGLVALGLLGWALRMRVRGEVACPLPATT